MEVLAILGMAIFIVLLFSMSMTAGTKSSISQLAEQWRWLLLAALWSQVLLLPQMLSITPEAWKWTTFVGMGGIVICGGASVLEKEDELIHMIAAAITFVCFVGWVMLMNNYCLIALIMCIAAGRENFKWRLEVGLIISVYLTLILDMYAK